MERLFIEQCLQDANCMAALHMIRCCEGTTAEDGYSYLFGSNPHNDIRFHDFSDHPNIARPFGETTSSAAGAFQIMHPTWLELKAKLQLTDFSPESQQLCALELISGRDAIHLIKDGKLEEAISKINTIWASLPGSPYGQPVKTLDDCKQFFTEGGGTLA